MIPQAPDKLGGYQVLHQLKAGGMGQVLLARKTGAGGFERLAAVKTIKAELRDRVELRAMFLDEAKLLARLTHPGIAQIYDFGEEEDGTLFLAMEYVAGVRFTELSRRELDPAIAARAMAQVCRGLHAAHELTDLHGRLMGVVHRDVTPENLMLTFEGRIKVLDFGIALVRGRTAPVTEYGTIKGKPPYLSPEQIKNQPVDRRTDIFSAAVVLHELLTGEPVFHGESVYAIARAIETADIEPPSQLLGETLPDGLDEVVMTGMRRDPDERFQNALAMAEALERVAERAGGESLERFARRELADELAEHRAWLRDIVDSPDGARRRPIGRASGVMTAQAVPAGDGPPLSPRRLAEAAVSVDTGSSTDDELRLLRQARGSRGRVIALVALLGILAGAAAWLLWRRSGGEEVAAAAIADAGVALAQAPADAAPRVAETPPDAAAVAVVDPPPPGPAPVPVRADRGHRHRSRPDAGVAVRPPPPPPPAATGTGRLTIAADPYALVRIDGVEIGSTPIFDRPIAAGSHEVVLVHPDSGAVRMKKTVQIRAGKLSRVVAK